MEKQRRRCRHRLTYPLLALASAAMGCSSESPVLFTSGDPAELRLAEDIALHYLDERLAREGRASREHARTSAVFVDDLAMAHVRVQQVERGVPVFGGEAIVHLAADGTLFDITDARVQGLPGSLATEPELEPSSAIERALAAYECAECLTAPPQVDLWILQRPESRRREARLSYRVQLERLDGSDRTSKPVIFIDAETGEELWRYDNLQTGTGASYYSGQVPLTTSNVNGSYYLQDTTRRLGTYTFNGATSTLYYVPSNDDTYNYGGYFKAMVDAHYGASKFYDYFKLVHGRNGIDGNNGPGASAAIDGSGALVVVATNYGTQYNDAYWDGARMVFGDGDGVNFGPLVSLDVGGHEMTHGIVDRTAKLIFSGEAGAIHESWADVFGALVERFARGESLLTWRIGEEVITPTVAGDAIRFLDNPHAAKNVGYTADDDPDHYTERYLGPSDNGGVHVNSGIANKAFFLLARGGAHHKGGSMADIGVPGGIGPDKAAIIWYRALTTYMTSTTDFAGARVATLNAAKALFGDQGVEYKAVNQAWLLVGVVGTTPSGGCTHDVCMTGGPLPPGCDACVTKVCASDAYCCSQTWDGQCVAEATNWCGKCDVDECAQMTANCDPKATCLNTPGAFKCMCPSLYNDVNGNGTSCLRHPSCKSLKAKQPNLPSGMYPLDPDGAGPGPEFNAYCDMTTSGGGWTLLFNEGPSFNKALPGTAGVDCFNNSGCKSVAFAAVPIGSDVMIDASDTPITGLALQMRSVILGVSPGVVGKTVQYLMNNGGNWVLEDPGNSNVLFNFAAGSDCNSWEEYTKAALCSTQYQLVFNDTGTSCGYTCPIGHTSPGNCACWNNAPNFGGINYFPDHFRVWVR